MSQQRDRQHSGLSDSLGGEAQNGKKIRCMPSPMPNGPILAVLVTSPTMV